MNGQTALIWAAFNGNVGILKDLIAARADLNLADNARRTPLMWAIEAGGSGTRESRLQCLQELLRVGADPNPVDLGGRTALMKAVIKGDADMVRALLGAQGIDLRLTDREGRTAADLAVAEGDVEVLALF
jgi:ankyrin repeat protein